MYELFRQLRIDDLAAILGFVVAAWSLVATMWRTHALERRETLALTALAVALAAFATERRRRRHAEFNEA